MRLTLADEMGRLGSLVLAWLLVCGHAAAQVEIVADGGGEQDPLMDLLQAGDTSPLDAAGGPAGQSARDDSLFAMLRQQDPAPGPAHRAPAAGLPLSPEMLAALQQQAVAQATQVTEEGQHRVDTFHWQLFASRIVFWLVVLVVLTGLVLAVRQVLRGATTVPPEDGKGAPKPLHEFEASLLGLTLKITTPGLGVVILMLSMLFFYMYVKEVFPIREI